VKNWRNKGNTSERMQFEGFRINIEGQNKDIIIINKDITAS
jgi:hypothetical protein